ncbi:quinone oxidoreductase [Hyphopichia burtonii NRRL Y-1933]|uniref:Quinone oxidoreductase n=1 Tax=Hyphopichia burtonii NRRL Y-1933 TaxID=984485 RepID=A0A1E4RCE9_9ASCO|nr:quinone oxidoreductase [Hyphopichia burtonii NRRL Y-1933]ODV64916.1 quinone oxidoreductase [Hyphopichia burtonii NRRL Y-1933]
MSKITSSSGFVLHKAPTKDLNFNLEAEDATFKLVERPIHELKKGELLVKTLYLSNDPTQRVWIQKGIKRENLYVEPVREGDQMRSSALGVVVDSKSPKFKKGDIINATLKWFDYCVIPDYLATHKIEDTSIPLTMYLDVLGVTGLTAYFGLFKVVNLKATDTILVSAASGATGSMVVQMAKKVIGCKKVIGISGGDDKCKFVESLGADKCLNYKDANFTKNLATVLGKDKFDYFFDGVGGRILDLGLGCLKNFGTCIACGAISGYNDLEKSKISNWSHIIVKRLNVKGFIVLDYEKQFQRAITDILQWYKEGKIQINQSTVTVVDLSKTKDQFTKVPQSWGMLFTSDKGPGKLLTKVAEPKL